MASKDDRYEKRVEDYYRAVFHCAAAVTRDPAQAASLTRLVFQVCRERADRLENAAAVEFLLLSSLFRLALRRESIALQP